MIEVVKFEFCPNKTRLGRVHVRYHDLLIFCELCLYKEQNLWVRMPEIWRTPESKVQFVYWEKQSVSDQFQKEVLKKVFDMVELTLESAITMKRNFFDSKKSLTKEKPNRKLNESPKKTPRT